MPIFSDPELLGVWAGAHAGFSASAVERGKAQLGLMAPPWFTLTDRTVLGRWLCLAAWISEHAQREMQVAPDQALPFWRGLRAVGEMRAAPTSGFGLALNDVVGNLRHLRHVQSGDQVLVGLAVGEFTDGLAARYGWRFGAPPTLAAYVVLAPRSAGMLAICALLSAVRSWGLADELPNSPARQLAGALGALLCLECDLQQPPAPVNAVALAGAPDGPDQAGRDRVAALAGEQRQALERLLILLPGRWAELAAFARHLVAVAPELAAL